MVAVVFIDLVGSSRVPRRRRELQQLLFALRDRLNAERPGEWIAPFQVVWGDELKGALKDPHGVWDLYQTAYAFMRGTPFYFSVGLGSLDTIEGYEPTQNIDLLDGTAFKAAREAMERLKAKEMTPYRVSFGSAGSQHYVDALNSYIGVLNDLVHHMTPAQQQHFVREFPWNAMGQVSLETTVSRQAVWETLQRARIDAYREANKGIEALLQLACDYEAIVLPNEAGDTECSG